MSADIDDRLSALFDELADHVPIEPIPPLDLPQSGRRSRGGTGIGRRLALQAAAAVLVVGGSVAVIATRARETGPANTPPEATATPDNDVDTGPTPLFTAAAQRIEWSVIDPDSSIGEAQISSIAAGPGGFVAVGLGFDGDLTAGQGRVWFSTDGVTWAEPDRDLFAPQGIYMVAATSHGYYLYATPTPPTEGSPAEPAQLSPATKPRKGWR